MAETRPGQLKMLSPGQIRPNPENPRLIFRQEEMEQLLVSIDKHGIQVPITVFEGDDGYILIDGERRWRCASKLNLRAIPAIIHEKPSELDNLVLMYNIHALREQWDYYTIASKLERVISLFRAKEGYEPGEVTLSELTGLTRGAIRRCYLLLRLPERFKDLLIVELRKPKSQQRLSEDLFIEMEKSLKTVVNRLPEYQPTIDNIRDALVSKFRSKTISAVTDFRQLSKIATAVEGLGIAHRTATRALDKIFDPNSNVGIKQAYADTVEFEYEEKKALRSASQITEFLVDTVQRELIDQLDEELVDQLQALSDVLQAILVSRE